MGRDGKGWDGKGRDENRMEGKGGGKEKERE